MFEKLETTVARYHELTRQLGDPALFNDTQRTLMREVAQEHAALEIGRRGVRIPVPQVEHPAVREYFHP